MSINERDEAARKIKDEHALLAVLLGSREKKIAQLETDLGRIEQDQGASSPFSVHLLDEHGLTLPRRQR